MGPVRAQSLHTKKQGGLHALTLWGTHVHGFVSKTPICPVLASRLLAGEVFAGCLSSKSCFCILLSQLSTPTLFGASGLPLGVPSIPLIQVASTTAPTTAEYTPFQAFSCGSRLVPGVHPTPLRPPPNQPRGWGMGTPRFPGAQQSCILSLLLSRHLVSPCPWGCRVPGMVAAIGVGGCPGALPT